MAAVAFTPKVFKLETTTNTAGKFDVPHGLNPRLFVIRGITVAIWTIEMKSWYTIWHSDTVCNEFRWNDTNVSGGIASGMFGRQKVRIVIIAEAVKRSPKSR
jgi:hypothetical protein